MPSEEVVRVTKTIEELATVGDQLTGNGGGQKGDTGDKGEAGEQGAQGEHGEQGARGERGAVGPPGASAETMTTALEQLSDVNEKLDVQGRVMDVILRGQAALVAALLKAGITLPAELLVHDVDVKGRDVVVRASVLGEDSDSVHLE